MTDGAETSEFPAPTAGAVQPVAASGADGWTPQSAASDSAGGAGAERPEILVGAAFAGGLLLATILKRLGR